MRTTGYGEALHRRFRLDNIPTLLSGVGGRNSVTFARLRCDILEHGSTGRAAAEDAYSLQILQRPMPALEVITAPRRHDIKSTQVGSLFLFNLHHPPTVFFHDPIDTIRFYVPAPALREAIDEHGVRQFRALSETELGTGDEILYRLAAVLRPALEGDHTPSQLFVDHIATALLAHLVHTYGSNGPVDMPSSGGLASRQLRRATDYLLAHLAGDPSLDQVATQCGLSRSSFARRFKASTGCAPYQWLLERRMTTARHLLQNTGKSAQQIARDCGFATQSRFNKLFKQRMGMSPGAFRRSR